MELGGRAIILALLCAAAGLASAAAPPPGVSERSLNDGQLVLQDVPDIPLSLAQRVRQFQNVRSASFLDWTADGKGMYVLTRFATLNQVHRVDHPGGARQQLTWFEEPVGEAVRQPGGSLIALTMDSGGSEFSQIMLFDPASGSASLLTDGTSRNTRPVWAESGTRLAYQSTRRTGSSNDIWLMDARDPGSARMVLEAEPDSWWIPVDFTPDGEALLVQELVSATDSRIYLLDLASGQRRLVAGGEPYPSANRAVVFDPDGLGFYFITNARGLAAELAWKSLAPDGTAEFISTHISWDVSEFALSPDGRRGAFTTNEEGISRLYLLDTRSRRYALVENLPPGLIQGLRFNPDSRRLALTMNTAQTPSDAFVIQLGRRPLQAASMSRWTRSEVGGLDTSRFVDPELVHYPSFDLQGEVPRQIPAFLYLPPGEGPFPVIIYLHGGPEGQYRPAFSSMLQMWLLELGAAVIAPNVRGSLGYGNEYMSLDDGLKREDAVRDIGALLDWIAAHPALDAQRVAAYGSSYGGYLVLAAAVHYGNRLKAAVDMVGISHFVTFLENTQEYRRDLRRREYGDERDPAVRAFLDSISPLTQADRIDVPLLVLQGQNDPRVPVGQSGQIVEALRARGRPVWYINALNEGHGYRRKENLDVAQQAVMLFLQRYLLN